MKIILLILHRCKRLSLNDINHIEIKPGSPIIMFLGRNGCGKSSVLNEWSPLPADIKYEYYEDGYKEVHIEHNNSEYKLTSGKISKSKHSFIKDGKELNDGGTKKVQLYLVSQHLNYNPEIHRLLSGETNFTTMSVGDRKKWISSISKDTSEYALKVYVKLKQKHRDIIGAIKLINEKILECKESTLSEDEILKYKEELKELNGFQETLFKARTNVHVESLDDRLDNIDVLTNNAESMYDRFIKLSKPKHNKETLTLLHEQTETKIKEYEDKLKSISELELKAGNKDIDNLTKDIEMLSKDINDIAIFEIALDNLDNTLSLYKSKIESVNDVLVHADVYTEYKDIDLNKQETKTIALKNKLDSISFSLKENILKNDQYVKISANDKISCVKCGHQWIYGYDKLDHNKTKDNIKMYTELKDKFNKEYVKQSEIFEKAKLANTVITTVKSFFTMDKNIMLCYNLFKDNLETMGISNAFMSVTKILSSWDVLPSKIEQLKKYKSNLDVANKLNTIEINKELSNKKEYEDTLSKLYLNRREYIKDIEYLEMYNSSHSKLLIIHNELKKSILNYKGLVDKVVESKSNEMIDNLVLEVKKSISKSEITLRDAVYKQKELTGHIDNVKSLRQREIALKHAMDALSPSDGLIAESIYGFIKNLMSKVNGIIGDVWSYDLEVLPCSLDENFSLNYRFPARIDDNNIVKDIQKTSSSMKEIIDLSFRIMVMRYLNMDSYPLFLDEFGRTMDTHHRNKVFSIIDILRESSFEQIVMVSHFESIYTRFNDCDVTVLDDNNISLSSTVKYNKSVKINP